ncbi:M14 family zinc carboxypeptidase [Nocardia sp. NPDC050406]|uniref:M14 family zinc carboxypeptidase n=1 Tax=Nocardia sp. NPDC050406 TaxID=3364318 RepID=UPI0037AA0DCF
MREIGRRHLFGLAGAAAVALPLSCAREAQPPRGDEVARWVGEVAELTSYPTVDELNAAMDRLAAEFPDRVSVAELGRSRAGEPIRVVRIGTGAHSIAVLGNPHPNEPIGMATIRHLTARLTDDPAMLEALDATWHFVPCVDPDGTRLNEGWYPGPHTRTSVGRHFYRPPTAEQPEWCFPTEWRGRAFGTPMPETQALMRLIDDSRPAFIASLHNADFGGGFFYTSGGDTSYWSALTDRLTAADIPIHGGQPDAPGARRNADGVFALPTIVTMSDAVDAVGVDPLTAFSGGGVLDYSARYRSAVLVAELPLWTDPRVADDTPSGQALSVVMDKAAAAYGDLARLVGEALDPVTGGSEPGPLERAVRAMAASLPEMVTMKLQEGQQDRIATVGEVWTEEYVWVGMLRLRLGGMLLRVLDDYVARGVAAAGVQRARVAALFDRWSADIESVAPGQPVPPRRLVEVQSAAILTGVVRVRDGLPV